MPLNDLLKVALISSFAVLVGCQTLQTTNETVSETRITEDRVESTEPSAESASIDNEFSEGERDAVEGAPTYPEPVLTDESMYDPLAIVRELGEAVDSPNVVETYKDEEPMVEPFPDLAAIEGTIWAEIIGRFDLDDLKSTKFADLHRRRLTHSPGFFAEFLVKADLYLPYVWGEVKRRNFHRKSPYCPMSNLHIARGLPRGWAVGMWQIMPGTARVLKLKLGQTCDQRRDVIH